MYAGFVFYHFQMSSLVLLVLSESVWLHIYYIVVFKQKEIHLSKLVAIYLSFLISLVLVEVYGKQYINQFLKLYSWGMAIPVIPALERLIGKRII